MSGKKDKFYVIGELVSRSHTLRVGIGEPPKKAIKADIVQLLFLDMQKKTKQFAVMTPSEAVLVGVHLIRASILAKLRLQKQEENTEWAANNWEKFFTDKVGQTQ